MSSSIVSSYSPTVAIENYFKTNGDKRVAELRFMDNPWEVLIISTFYVYFCYDLGPHRLMKNRKPFDLVWTVRAFNAFILLLNVWLLKRHFSLLNWGYDSLGCSVSIFMSSKLFNFFLITCFFIYLHGDQPIDQLVIKSPKSSYNSLTSTVMMKYSPHLHSSPILTKLKLKL